MPTEYVAIILFCVSAAVCTLTMTPGQNLFPLNKPPIPSDIYKEGLIKEGLIKSARAICEIIFTATRRDFAGIIVFISRNHNEVAVEIIRKAP